MVLNLVLTQKNIKLLPDISHEEARIEIEESKTKISSMISSDVSSFCYPAGRLNDSVINMVRQAGYQCGVITLLFEVYQSQFIL